MALRTRVWSAGKLLVLAGALFITYVLFAAASMRLALRTRVVEVPDLMSRTANEATALAADRGLSIRVDDVRRTDPKLEAGRVIAQDPPPGSTLRSQRTLRVWLSAGQHAAKVPQLAGETERAAQQRLTQDGFAVRGVSEIRSQRYPPDVIVAQDPLADAASGEIALLVNRAEQGESYVMPDLIGVNADRAIEVLRSRGFRAAAVGGATYSGVAPGIVLRQNPRAGYQIAPGEPISIEVSR